MKTEIKLIHRTDDSFARFLMPDGSTINYTDVEDAYDALATFFNMNKYGIEAYMNSSRDCSWQSTEYKCELSHTTK